MDHYDYDPGRSFERRIGQRAETESVEVGWVLPASGLLRTERVHPGRIEQVSLTGAAITGPAGMRAEVGDTVLIRYRGGDSSVIIRRLDPTDDAAVRRFGVELVVVHPLLQAELFPGQRQPSPAEGAGEASPATEGSSRSTFGDVWGEELQLPEPAVEEVPVAEADPTSSPVDPFVGTGTSAADADEVQDLVDELRRFMED